MNERRIESPTILLVGSIASRIEDAYIAAVSVATTTPVRWCKGGCLGGN